MSQNCPYLKCTQEKIRDLGLHKLIFVLLQLTIIIFLMTKSEVTTESGGRQNMFPSETRPYIDESVSYEGYPQNAEKVNGNQMDDVETFVATYTYGPVSAGIQVSDIDYAAADTGISRDASTTYMGIAFNVNENLSISYGEQETDLAGVSVDQELEGFSIGYSMGGLSIAMHANEGDNIGNTANNYKHTELSVSFAF